MQAVAVRLWGNREYRDAQYMTAEEKRRAFRTFQKVIRSRSIERLDKNLYRHLTQHCGFIAHFDIEGFKAAYRGRSFRRFVEHFDRNHPNFGGFCPVWVDQPEYADINRDMVDFVTAEAPRIYAELDEMERQAELAALQALAAKHGYRLVKEG